MFRSNVDNGYITAVCVTGKAPKCGVLHELWSKLHHEINLFEKENFNRSHVIL